MADMAKGFFLTLALVAGVVFLKSELTSPPVLGLQPGDPVPAALSEGGTRDQVALVLRAEHCFTCTLPTAALRRIQADTTLAEVPIVGYVVGGDQATVRQLFREERIDGTVTGLPEGEHERELDGARLPILLVIRESRVAFVRQFEPASNTNLDPDLEGKLRQAWRQGG